MGWGGIVAMGVAGAAAGAGQAGYDDIVTKEKNAAMALRDQQLSALNTQHDITVHQANLQFDTQNKIDSAGPIAAAENAAQQGVWDNGGRTRAQQSASDKAQAEVNAKGVPDTTSIPQRDSSGNIVGWDQPPAKKLPQQLGDYYQSEADWRRSEVVLNEARAEATKTGKATLPTLKNSTDDNGGHAIVDEKYGLTGHIVPGTPDTPAEDPGWVSKFFGVQGTPAKKGTPTHIEWSDSKGVVNLSDYYPAIKQAEDAIKRPQDDGQPAAQPSSSPAAGLGTNKVTGPISSPGIVNSGSVPQGTPANGQPTAGFPGVPKGAGYTGRAAPVDRLSILQGELSDEQNKDTPDPRNVSAIQTEIAKVAKSVPAHLLPGAMDTGRTTPQGKRIFQTPDGQKWVD